MDRAETRKITAYWNILTRFMEYWDKKEYGKDAKFNADQLEAITPEELVSYFSFKVYGVTDPGPEDLPKKGRSSSILFWKKAISYYIPNKLEGWNNKARTGNPTKSLQVNELIKRVKKREVRRQGVQSQARRALTATEFESIIKILRSSNKDTHKFFAPAFHIFQYNMIARLDDTAHLQLCNIKANHDHDFTLLAQMSWSKNVHEERDAPDQILFGAMDTRYCPILALAIHLEWWFATSTGSTPTNPFVFGLGGEDPEKGPDRTKTTVYSILKRFVFTNPSFQSILKQPIGTHSFRKFPATRARKKGASKDDVDARGRWKNKSRTSDVYMDISLPYNDARVASKLCTGGACKYALKDGAGVTREWVVNNVTPLICQRMDQAIAFTLGLALLWAVYNDEACKFVPTYLEEKIKKEYTLSASPELQAGYNPVEKVLLSIAGDEGELFIIPIQTDPSGAGTPGQACTTHTGNQNETIDAVMHHVASIYKEQSETRVEMEFFRKEV